MFFGNLSRQKDSYVRGKKSDTHLRITKRGFRDRQYEIAHGGDAAAACDGCAVDCRNRRLWETPDSPEKPREPSRILEIFFRRLRGNRPQRPQVDPRTKGLALAGENRNA